MLYRYYYAYGMSICLRYTKNRDEALEVLNDSFLKVFENISTYDTSKPFKSWFRQITVNTCIDFYRKNKRLSVKDSLLKNDYETYEYDKIDELEVEDILKLIRSIPDYYALIFNLYEIEGFDHNEIAEKLNITASTSRANLSRAKKMIRELFEKQNYTHYVSVI